MTSATPSRMSVISSLNPTTGRPYATYAETTETEVDGRLAAADRAYRETLLHSPEGVAIKRARMLLYAADRLESGVEEFARMLTREMGKTVRSARAEVLKSAACCRYYAERGGAMLLPEKAESAGGKEAEIRYEPLGTVLAVMPWNFPFWQVFRCAAPILLSGNSYVLKHASNVPESAMAIDAIFQAAFRQAGLDPGAFATLLLPSTRIDGLIADPRVRGVTLTGSEGAGRAVAAKAGNCLKKTVLELGGSDPFILFATASLDKAVTVAVESRMIANGQSCIAAKRFLIHDSLYDRFREEMLDRFRTLKVGDPMLEGTDLGPLAGEKNRHDLHELVDDARARGARITLGGEISRGDGYFYPPTMIEEIPENARLYREEAFGPVASLYRFRTHDEMLEIANAPTYGLGASIWTADPREIELCARRLETGQLFVNTLVASDPGLPFGGVKDSGYGRELGTYGVREWTIPRTVVRSV